MFVAEILVSTFSVSFYWSTREKWPHTIERIEACDSEMLDEAP